MNNGGMVIFGGVRGHVSLVSVCPFATGKGIHHTPDGRSHCCGVFVMMYLNTYPQIISTDLWVSIVSYSSLPVFLQNF